MSKVKTDRENIMASLDKLEKWLGGLPKLEQENFDTLINLPNAEELISGMKKSKCRDMAMFAFSINEALTEIEGESNA